MKATRRELLQLAAATGFEGGTLEKVMRLSELLAALNGHAELRDGLVLKGGTALNLFFGAPTRLSVDLDFNYVGALERAEMKERRPHIEHEIERVARLYGYTAQRSSDAHAGRKIYLSYRRTLDGLGDRVEIDVNFLHRLPLLSPEPRTMWQPDGSAGPTVAVLSFEELAAGKLMAFLDRGLPRDAWDVSRLPTMAPSPWPEGRGRRIFVAMAGALAHPLHAYAEKTLDRITALDVERQLQPLLLASTRPQADDLRDEAWEVVRPLLQLTEEERRFTDAIQRGELHPAALFPEDGALVDRVGKSPPLLWKALNARKHHGDAGRGTGKRRA